MLESLAISDSRKSKIRNLLENSTYRGVYADYLLAKNPDEFRDSLKYNKQFAEDAQRYDINPDVLVNGVEDSGIEIKLQDSNSGVMPAKLVNYAN